MLGAMARLSIDTRGRRGLVAESDDELALLDHARQTHGKLVLEGGYYAVQGQRLLLPPAQGEGTIERLRRAFEAAALNHAEALARRGSFHLVDR